MLSETEFFSDTNTSRAVRKRISVFLHNNNPTDILSDRIRINYKTGLLISLRAQNFLDKSIKYKTISVRLPDELRTKLEILSGILQVSLKDLASLAVHCESLRINLDDLVPMSDHNRGMLFDMYGNIPPGSKTDGG
jgi:hypothetical protein